MYANTNLFADYQSLAQSNYESIYGTTDGNLDWLDAIYRTGSIQKTEI